MQSSVLQSWASISQCECLQGTDIGCTCPPALLCSAPSSRLIAMALLERTTTLLSSLMVSRSN
eukprot:102221-Amphidinium_carterae.1